MTQIANVADQRLNAIQSGENAGYAELLKRIKSIEDQLDHVPLFTFEENDDDEVTLRLTDRNEQKEAEDEEAQKVSDDDANCRDNRIEVGPGEAPEDEADNNSK